MREATKQLAAQIIPRNSSTWHMLQSAYYTPRNTVRGIYRRITKNSIFFDEQELGMASLVPFKKIDKTIAMFAPKTILDVGCGVGKSLDYMLDKGIKVEGIEGSELAIRKANHSELITRFNLNNELNLGRKFDLLWCFEVAEHIHPVYVDNLMKTLTNHADRIVMSAARPGQGGEGHFNEQLPEYWIEKFIAQGFKYDEDSTQILRSIDEMFSPNMLVFHA